MSTRADRKPWMSVAQENLLRRALVCYLGHYVCDYYELRCAEALLRRAWVTLDRESRVMRVTEQGRAALRQRSGADR